jgi:hypothetical protein
MKHEATYKTNGSNDEQTERGHHNTELVTHKNLQKYTFVKEEFWQIGKSQVIHVISEYS